MANTIHGLPGVVSGNPINRDGIKKMDRSSGIYNVALTIAKIAIAPFYILTKIFVDVVMYLCSSKNDDHQIDFSKMIGAKDQSHEVVKRAQRRSLGRLDDINEQVAENPKGFSPSKNNEIWEKLIETARDAESVGVPANVVSNKIEAILNLLPPKKHAECVKAYSELLAIKSSEEENLDGDQVCLGSRSDMYLIRLCEKILSKNGKASRSNTIQSSPFVAKINVTDENGDPVMSHGKERLRRPTDQEVIERIVSAAEYPNKSYYATQRGNWFKGPQVVEIKGENADNRCEASSKLRQLIGAIKEKYMTVSEEV